MKKIIFITLITSALMSNAMAEKIDCNQFEKVSAKYIECSAKNLKEKSSELKLKATVGAEEIKDKISRKTNEGKYAKGMWTDSPEFLYNQSTNK